MSLEELFRYFNQLLVVIMLTCDFIVKPVNQRAVELLSGFPFRFSSGIAGLLIRTLVVTAAAGSSTASGTAARAAARGT